MCSGLCFIMNLRPTQVTFEINCFARSECFTHQSPFSRDHNSQFVYFFFSVRLSSLSPVQRLSRWDRSLKPWSPVDRCETPDSLAPCQRSTLRRLCQNRRMLRTEAVRGWDSQPQALLAQSLSATAGGLHLLLLLPQPGGWGHTRELKEIQIIIS